MQNKNGQVIVEAVAYIGITLMGLITTAAMIFYYLSIIWLNVEMYLLARAHLYGNNLNHCEASQYWPQNEYLVPNFQCDFKGKVDLVVTLPGAHLHPALPEDSWQFKKSVNLWDY